MVIPVPNCGVPMKMSLRICVTGGGVTRFGTTAKTYTGETIITNDSTLRLNAANLISDSSSISVDGGSA